MSTQTDIRDILGEIASSGPIHTDFKSRIKTLMEHFAARNISIETCADNRHLNRSVSTVKGYAREFRLRFTDYVPMDLRTPEELKLGRKFKPGQAA